MLEDSGPRMDDPVILPPGRARPVASRARHRTANSNEDNGEGSGRLRGGQGDGCAGGDDDINLDRNQFGGERGRPLELPLGVPVFDHEAAASQPTRTILATC